MNKETLFQGLIMVLTLGFIIYFMIFTINLQLSMAENFNDYCNEKYGSGNWEVVEKDKETFREKTYLGIIWTCGEIEE